MFFADTKDKENYNKDLEAIKDECIKPINDLYDSAHTRMLRRTKDFRVFDRIAHMLNLYDAKDVRFSEGSTQAILRKARAQTVQRCPDGIVQSQFDEESYEKIELDYLFNNKILDSEFSNQDFHSIAFRMFTTSWIYGFSVCRTGFVKDRANDIRISIKEIPYTMICPEPDCDSIDNAAWYFVDEMISLENIRNLVDDNGKVKDSTYNQDVLDFILKYEYTDPQDITQEHKISEESKGISKTNSVRIRTLYKRGEKEFITYMPTLSAKFRTVKNYDPQLEVPLSFLILEPDSSFTLGLPSILPTLTHQQFADAFQSTAFQNLLLAARPPLQGWGNITPSTIRMVEGAWWNMGTNQNNKIEKFPVETTTLTNMGAIQETISSNMSKNMNIMDATIASDANVHAWSKTPQGVDQQQADKTITINQYQKRVEGWFNNFASHAIRSYVSAFTGKVKMTVDEDTRRLIADYENAQNATRMQNNQPELKSIIDGNKIEIDFNKLATDNLSFTVRSGAFVQSKKKDKIESLNQMLVSVSQSMGNVSEQNRQVFETVVMNIIERLLELSDIDFKASSSKLFNDKVVNETLIALIDYVKNNAKATQQLQQIVLNDHYNQPQQQGGRSYSGPQNPRQEELMSGQIQNNPGQQQQPQQQIPPEVMQAQAQQQTPQPGHEEDVQPLPDNVMKEIMSRQQQRGEQEPPQDDDSQEVPEQT